MIWDEEERPSSRAVRRTLLELMSEWTAENSARQLPSGSGKSELATEIAKTRGWKLRPLRESDLHPDDILGRAYLTEEGGEE